MGRSLKNAAAFVQDREVAMLLRNPSVNPEEIAQPVGSLLKKAEASEQETKVIMSLTANGRLALMPLIHERYTELSRAAQGIKDVRIVSAQKLTLQEDVKIKRLLRDHFKIKADITKSVDLALISVFTLCFDGRTIDQSARSYRARTA